jgi:hypothetical protein
MTSAATGSSGHGKSAGDNFTLNRKNTRFVRPAVKMISPRFGKGNNNHLLDKSYS